MKYIIILIFCCFPFFSFSQDILSVSEVFDFKPGDVFHYLDDIGNYSETFHSSEKKINRITILDRYYSETQDTLFYKRNVEGYTYYISGINAIGQPEYKYKYHSYQDSVVYTNLDSSVFYHLLTAYDPQLYFERFEDNYDTLIYYSPEYCSILVNTYRNTSWDY